MAHIERVITGNIEEWGTGNSYFTVFLRSNGRVLDSFDMTMENQEILTELREDTLILLGIHNSTQCYLELISELGLELPKPWHKYWTPTKNETFYFINQYSIVNISINYEELNKNAMLIKNYNAFPTRKLAEKAVNLSKLGRLILLWQYANECVFTPTWQNNNQAKYYVKYDHQSEIIEYYYYCTDFQLDNTYFETEEQAQAFIKAYDKEIKKIMGVI